MAAGLAMRFTPRGAQSDRRLVQPSTRRVLSVSASRATTDDRGDTSQPPVATHVESTLQRVRRESERLRHCIEQAAAHEVDMIETIHRVDERLSLAAQMLVAFQQQIERMEGAMETARHIERERFATPSE